MYSAADHWSCDLACPLFIGLCHLTKERGALKERNSSALHQHTYNVSDLLRRKERRGGNVEFLINAHWYVKTTGRFKSLLNIKHTKSPALRISMFARGHVVPQSPIVGARCKKYTIVYIPVFLR